MKLDYWQNAKKHLSKHDKTLKKIIASYEGEMLTGRGDAFYTLARSIAGQQISVKAADSVWKRVENAVPITPHAVAEVEEETLRSAGLSRQKVVYMHALAAYFLNNKKTVANLKTLDDETIIAELTSIKGIGRWTAEMFLIFHLGRPDVLPLADIGLQKAVFMHYTDGEKIPLKEIKRIAAPWQPYRSVATWYLWRALDPVPVAY